MNKKILSELGNYLLAHREQIIGEWLEAIEQNPDISSLAHLKDEEELADHLPELCKNLGEAPKGSPIGSKACRGNPCCTSPWQIPLAARLQARGSHTRS